MYKKNNTMEGLGLIILSMLIYFFTISPLTKEYSFAVLSITSLLFVASLFFRKQSPLVFRYSLMSMLLLAVAITGWFYSPIFYWMYLASIACAFLYNYVISSLYVLLMFIILLPNIGSIDQTWDMLTLISLAAVIPLSYYLRQEYLSRKEEEKDILVLEKEGKYGSLAEKALSNKVTNIAMRLREKIVDIKQMAYLLNRKVKSEEENKRIGRIVSISDETLDLVNDFEETSTGKRVISKSH